ncbi:non-ribosomal peptide synthetase, partial [Aquimarina sp. AU474]|uniref:non-ribosomal peptide synthetase n=1 Tax=Aquimarina sp. AU474 TaxID=2108529 RepID=UPI00135A939C
MTKSDKIFNILKKIKDANFRLYLDDSGNLKLDTYKGKLDDSLKEDIVENKEGLIQFLKGNIGYTKIERSEEKLDYSLSHAQRRLYFMYEFDKSSVAYNMPEAIELEGKFDIQKLKNVFKKLIGHHEILRTSFNLIEGEVFQRIHENVSFEIEYYESEYSETTELMKKFVRPFDLSAPCLMRIGLIELPTDSQILMLDMHHIISDGVSQNILVKDFMSLYAGKIIEPLRLRYCDYAEWQLSAEQKENLTKQREFWLNEYANEINSLDLPLDYKRPVMKSHLGSSISFSVSQKQTNNLRNLAKENGVTMFMLILSLYNVLLSKLTSQEDIIVGTPISGREHPDLEPIMGMFVNTIPLRNYPNGEEGFLNFLSDLKQRVVSCFENQSFLYEELIEELDLSRLSNRNPLFDVLFAYHNFESETLEIRDLIFKRFDTGHEISKFDLNLVVMEGEKSLEFRLEYSSELFERKTIEKFSSYFQRIVSAVIETPDMKICDIKILSTQEENELITSLDNIEVSYPQDKTIIELFESQVDLTPENICVTIGDESITYKDLNSRANSLAIHLRNLGVEPNQVIGLLMEKSIDLIIGMLGILKSGGGYLPLDIEAPEQRITYILEDSEASILVTHKEYSKDLKYNHTTVLLEKIENEWIDKNIEKVNQPSDLCYVIYTSGTTGNPKGVMLEHKNVVRLFINDQNKFDFSSNDVWTLFHNHTFDFSVWEIYGALLFGGKLVIIPKIVTQDPKQFLNILQQEGVTILNQTPSAFYNLIETGELQEISSLKLRMVIFGGEALAPSKLILWKRKYPHIKLINMYGITETTVHVTYKEITENEISKDLRSVGSPLPTLGICILDKYKNIVPKGVKGEICVGGKGVARGYLNRNDLTIEKFINNPYKKNERLYCSGDLGRILQNGEIEYLGRIDDQIKLRGFRIELKEIEEQLSSNEKISKCVVLFESREEDNFLIAYYVSKDEIPLSELRNYLAEKLPNYMIPSFFVSLKEIPLTPNGKVDKRTLKNNKITVEGGYITAQNPQEEKLLEIWQRILSVESLGTNSNFFLSGGDSIKAIKLIYNVNAEFNDMLNLANLYSHPTVKDFSDYIYSFEGNEEHKNKHYLEVEKELNSFEKEYLKTSVYKNSYESVFPMSGIEKGMLFYTMMKEDTEDNYHNILYHEQNVYSVRYSNFDFILFKKVISLLIETHSELRKVYDIKYGAHIILKEIQPELHYIDLSQEERGNQEEMYLKKINDGRLRASGDSMEVLWRMNVLKINEGFHYLIFDFHHSLFDGWSLHQFLTLLNNTYLKLNHNPDLKLEPFKSNYKDHILQELVECRKESTIAYWQNEMNDYKRLELTRTGDTYKYVSQRYEMGSELKGEFENIASFFEISLKELCFAAYLYTLKIFTGSDELVTGMITNNRPVAEDGEKVLGCFLNQVPFRITIPKSGTWKDYIELVAKKIRRQKEHERMPFYRILEVIDEPSVPGVNPVFDATFNFIDFWIVNEMVTENDDVNTNEREDINFWHDDISVVENTLLDFHVVVTHGNFTFNMVYSSAVANHEMVEQFFTYCKNVLFQFKNLTSEIGVEKIMPKTDRLELQNSYHVIDSSYPLDKTFVDLFEDQVSMNSDTIAVDDHTLSLSYGDLNHRCNQFSHFLLSKGLSSEESVVFLCDRSTDYLIGMLGVFKSSGV